MKIGITCYPVAGGSGVVATELGQQLANRGHEVHFISYAVPFRMDRYQSNLMYHGVQTTAYPLFKFPPYTETLASKMAEVARSYNLDILHVHYAIPHATCAYLAGEILRSRGCRRPAIVTTLHGTDITLVGSDPSFYDITRFSIESSDNLTAVSRYLADETVEVFKITRPIHVVHNFFDPTRFRPDINPSRRRDLASDDEVLIMHVSNFRPVKRTLDVVDVFSRIAEAMPARLVLIGEGPDTVLVRRNVHKKKLADRVVFLGNQTRVEAVLPCSDLFLLPSEEESFGLAALEALACGVPVIGTAGTGLDEVIDDGQSGFLLPVGDTEAMARRGIDLLSETARLSEFKQAAARKALEKFSADKIVTEYEECYREVVDG